MEGIWIERKDREINGLRRNILRCQEPLIQAAFQMELEKALAGRAAAKASAKQPGMRHEVKPAIMLVAQLLPRFLGRGSVARYQVRPTQLWQLHFVPHPWLLWQKLSPQPSRQEPSLVPFETQPVSMVPDNAGYFVAVRLSLFLLSIQIPSIGNHGWLPRGKTALSPITGPLWGYPSFGLKLTGPH